MHFARAVNTDQNSTDKYLFTILKNISDDIISVCSIVSDTIGAHEWEMHIIESCEGGARFEITGVELNTE